MSAPRWAARRNATLAAASGAALLALLLYPTSTSGTQGGGSDLADAASEAAVKADESGGLVVDGPAVDTDYGLRPRRPFRPLTLRACPGRSVRPAAHWR